MARISVPRAISASVSRADVGRTASRSLYLLEAIDETLDALRQDCDVFQVIHKWCQESLDDLTSNPPSVVLDPDRAIERKYAQVLEWLESRHAVASRARVSARADHQLLDDDGVEEAWTKYIACVSDLHEVVQSLSERIAVLDSLKSPRGKVYATAAEMMKDL